LLEYKIIVVELLESLAEQVAECKLVASLVEK